MKVGDLVRHKQTGELAVVTALGDQELEIWMTLIPMKDSVLGKDLVYLVEYFEVVSSSKE